MAICLYVDIRIPFAMQVLRPWMVDLLWKWKWGAFCRTLLGVQFMYLRIY